MEKLQYRISSRATILLGRESISRIESAVTEIVKNTYDADASMCFLTFDIPNDCIYIFDNGIGMTRKSIEDNWMLIGTDNKKVEYQSAKGRVRAGEKGIGRFALDRMGSICEMYTKTAAANSTLHWTTNWEMFEESGRLLDDMYATLEELPKNILNCLPLAISSRVESFCRAQANDTAFTSGTCFVIRRLRDHWGAQELHALEKSLEVLLPPANSGEFTIAIQDNINDEFRIINDNITEEYDYKVHAICDGQNVSVTLYRNEFDYDRFPKGIWQEKEFSESPYRYEDFEQGSFTFPIELLRLANATEEPAKSIVESIGPFEFEYVFMKLMMSKESREIHYAKEISKNRREWMQLHSGIKIYRDGFWVRPYGDPNGVYDWLNLDARRAQNPTSVSHESETWNVRNAQGYGLVQVSRIYNPYIVDVSSREGLVYNDTFKYFRRILVNIIALFERDRAHIAHGLKKYYDKVNQTEKIKRQGLEIAKKLLKKTDSESDSKQTDQPGKPNAEDAKILAQAVKFYQEEHDELISEIALLRALATSGLVTASIVHDLKSLQANLGVRIDNLRTSMQRADTNMIERRLNTIKKDDEFMKSWISVVATQSRADKRKRKKHELGSLIAETVESIRPILQKKQIDIEVLSNGSFERRVFPIDITSIVFNLVINSIEAFAHSKVDARKITINLHAANEFVFTYSDNGSGISDEFENPYDIFKFGTTSKYDINGDKEGTGMGMYIVYTTLREYNSKPVILNAREGFQVQFKLQK